VALRCWGGITGSARRRSGSAAVQTPLGVNIAPPQPDGWKQPCTPVAMRADISSQNPHVWVLEVMWVADGAGFTGWAANI